MTAPLYEVKNKLSEYVSLAERGETISITKHGKPVAFVLGADAYEKLEKKEHTQSFAEALAAWRARCGDDLSDETPWDNIRSKEVYQEKDIWGD